MRRKLSWGTTVFAIVLLCTSLGVNAQNTSAGTGWGGLNPSEALVINENFQGFEFFHSDENPDQGNSSHALNEESGEIVYNYKTMETSVVVDGATIKYQFIECAFAPEWSTAYAFKNETENTEGVSNGFVEISRFDTIYSQIHTARGYVVVDLSEMESVEMIQYSHSSTGGNKRGVMVEFSVDKGETWDTLRYQPGTNYNASFTKDPFSLEKTGNTYSCDPSAYGMLWEDAIYWYDGNFMLRFGECGGQTVRLHDLKVYGTAGKSARPQLRGQAIQMKLIDKTIRLSEKVERLEVYSLAGQRVFTASEVSSQELSALQSGVYLVRALNNGNVYSEKIMFK